MNRLMRLAGWSTLALAATVAQAQNEIYKCVDEGGRAQYTNLRRDAQGRGCTLVTREVSVVPAGAPGSSAAGKQPDSAVAGRPSAPQVSQANFPRVDPQTQKARDGGRRKILEDELATEEKSLVDARAKLGEQEQIRNGDEKNYQRVLDRLQPYKEAIDQHERNVAALKSELAKLR